MSTHINAPDGAIADTVLLPGDPLRAKFIAENFLENAVCYNEVRGMYGFTGTYNGKKVSVQGTGMGQPSLSIYVQELFQFYNVQKAVRIGTCGSIREDVKVRDIIIANKRKLEALEKVWCSRPRNGSCRTVYTCCSVQPKGTCNSYSKRPHHYRRSNHCRRTTDNF